MKKTTTQDRQPAPRGRRQDEKPGPTPAANPDQNPNRKPDRPRQRPSRDQGGPSAMLVIPLRPSGAPFWENESITVRAPDGGTIPRPDVPNKVSVAIRNVGSLPALAVTVDFRYLAPATSATAQFPIAVVPNQLIRPGEEATVSCMWTPRLVDGIHQCLMVTCWALNDMQGLQPWQPQIERRCAQRNTSVLPMSPGKMMRSSLDFANIFPMRALTQLMARVDHMRLHTGRAEGLLSASSLASVLRATAAAETAKEGVDPRLAQPQIARGIMPVSLPAVRARLTESVGTISPVDARRQLANLLTADRAMTEAQRSPVMAGMTTLGEAMMLPFELRRVDFEVGAPEGSRTGDIFVYRFAQVAEGMLLGGYTVVVQVIG